MSSKVLIKKEFAGGERREVPWYFGFILPLLFFYRNFITLKGPVKAAALFSITLFGCFVFVIGASASGALKPTKQFTYKVVASAPEKVIEVPVERVVEKEKIVYVNKGASMAPREERVPENAKAYIAMYAKAAQNNMMKTGVPASITLAQGIVESKSGQSGLAKFNNHFGIKCFAKRHKGCCVKFHDDSNNDSFKIYPSVQACFEDHAIKVSSGRYKKLKKYGKDYKNWAYGLKACGYATDRYYARTLINTIERYNLHQFDK